MGLMSGWAAIDHNKKIRLQCTEIRGNPLAKSKTSWLSMLTGRIGERAPKLRTMSRSLEDTGPTGGSTAPAYDSTMIVEREGTRPLSRLGAKADDSSRNQVGAGSPLAQRAWQPEQQDIRRERLELIHRMLPTSMAAGFVTALAFLALAWNTPRFTDVCWWFGGAVVALLVRAYLLWRGSNYLKHREIDLDRWEWELILNALLGGLVWASLLVFIPPANALSLFLYFTVLIIICFSTVQSACGYMPVFWANVAPVALAGIYLMLTHQNTLHPVFWLLAVVFILMIYAALNVQRYLINENVKYRLTNSRLTAEMMVTLEDPSAGVLRVLKGDIRYANERMSELTGMPVDTLMRSTIASVLGPGPWSDPNWTQLKQALAHGLPQTFNWWLPQSSGQHLAVRVRTRGVWDFSQSHGGVMLFSPLSPAPLFSTSLASESLPIMTASLDDWLTYARADRRKRSANPVMVAVIRPIGAAGNGGFQAWREEQEGQLLRRLSPREMICFDAASSNPGAYLWLSATVRDLTTDQLRAALITSLTQGATQYSVAVPEEVAQLEMGDGAELARLRHGATLQVGIAKVDHDVEPDEALELAIANTQTVREGKMSVSRPRDSQP